MASSAQYHFLPRGYLDGFTDPVDGKLWALGPPDRKTSDFFRRTQRESGTGGGRVHSDRPTNRERSGRSGDVHRFHGYPSAGMAKIARRALEPAG